MRPATCFDLAWRNLWRNARRSRLVVSVVGMGIVALVVFNSLTDAVNEFQNAEIIGGQTGSLQVHRRGYAKNEIGKGLQFAFADTPVLRRAVLGVSGVVAVSPRLDFGARLSVPDAASAEGDPAPRVDEVPLRIMAIDPETLDSVLPLPFRRVLAGRAPRDPARDELLLHHTLVAPLKLDFSSAGMAARAGSVARPALFAIDAEGAPRARLLDVIGEFDEALLPLPKGFLTLASAQRLLDMPGRITTYMVRVDARADLESVRVRLLQALGDAYEVRRWDEIFPIIRELSTMNQRVFGVSMAVFLAVIGLAVVNSMMMTVMERVREIGTMSALGLTGRQVCALFLVEGLLAGTLGGGIGVALGAAVTAFMSWTGIQFPNGLSTVEVTLKPDVTAWFLGGAWALAASGCALAALWAAWRAARLSPVEALRKT